MIGYIRGRVVYKAGSYVVVEPAGGIGYRISTIKSKAEALSDGDAVEFFVFNNIKEDANDLYGLSTPADLAVFELLLSVSGVGPKVALLILDGLGREKIISAIESSDSGAFKAISGVGPKVAAKIIVELKAKVSGSSVGLLPQEDETVEALVSLGYKKQEILPLMAKIPLEMKSVEQKIKFVLSNVGKSK